MTMNQINAKLLGAIINPQNVKYKILPFRIVLAI